MDSYSTKHMDSQDYARFSPIVTPKPMIHHDESLSIILTQCGIQYSLPGEDMETVLAEALSRLILPREIDKESIRKAILDREELSSSAIGEGLAIPHCRHDSLTVLRHPIVSLNFPSRALKNWGLDPQEVRSFFLILCPDGRSHLSLMSRLSSRLRERAFHRLLDPSHPPEDVLNYIRNREEPITHPFY